MTEQELIELVKRIYYEADNDTSELNKPCFITSLSKACQYCSKNPSNGGDGICHCTLGSPQITC